jgi:hypothetical protein
MKPADIFGLVVRSAGLGVMIWGFWNLLSALSLSLDFVLNAWGWTNSDLYSPVPDIIYGLPGALAGYILVFHAHRVVEHAYRERHDRPSPPPLPPK